MAVFSLQKGEKWGKGAKKSIFQEEIFLIFILRVGTNAAKNRTNFAYYISYRANDAPSSRNIQKFLSFLSKIYRYKIIKHFLENTYSVFKKLMDER